MMAMMIPAEINKGIHGYHGHFSPEAKGVMIVKFTRGPYAANRSDPFPPICSLFLAVLSIV